MSNVNQNLLNQALSPETITSIMESLTAVESNLPDSTLTDEQRRTYNAISVDNKVFAEHVLDEMNINTTVTIPAFYNKEFLDNDLTLNTQAQSIRSRMLNIVQRLDDIIRLTGHEGYGMSTSVYGMFEMMARSGVPGAQASYDRLKERYQSQGGGSREPEPEP
ncbi:MAG: hypothetical protein JJE55_05605 [Flavobacteriaceae bacterium]|nr:hypothetical protein [Flavobacteriaceae bacterium]